MIKPYDEQEVRKEFEERLSTAGFNPNHPNVKCMVDAFMDQSRRFNLQVQNIGIDINGNMTADVKLPNGIPDIPLNISVGPFTSDPEGRPIKSSCDHDWKIYDSGWTREHYCTKCPVKTKVSL